MTKQPKQQHHDQSDQSETYVTKATKVRPMWPKWFLNTSLYVSLGAGNSENNVHGAVRVFFIASYVFLSAENSEDNAQMMIAIVFLSRAKKSHNLTAVVIARRQFALSHSHLNNSQLNNFWLLQFTSSRDQQFSWIVCIFNNAKKKLKLQLHPCHAKL